MKPSSNKFFLVTIILVFAALVVGSYWPVLLGKVPLPTDVITRFPPFRDFYNRSVMVRHAELGDVIVQFYPWRKFAAESIRQGVVPLWNPYLLAGTPFVANLLSAVFYPLNLVFVALPTPLAWSISLMLKVFFAGVFTALFLGEIGASVSGALVGGIAFAYGGFITSWLGWPQVDTSFWLPLICLQIHRVCREPSVRNALLLSPVLAMPILAGHPGMAVYVLFAAGAYGLWLIGWHRSVKYRQPLTALGIAGCLGLGIAAVQILPSAEWLAQIDRTLGARWAPLPPWQAMAFFSRAPGSAGLFIPVGAAYVGALSLLGAGLALFSRNKRDAVFFAASLAISCCVAYGVQPVLYLSDVVPVFNGLKKEEALMLADFSLAVLAGLGISQIETFEWKASTVRIRLLIVGTLLLVTGLLHYCTAMMSRMTNPPFDWWRSPRSFRVLLVLSALVILLRVLQVLPKRLWIVLSVAIAAADLVSLSYAHIPFNTAEAIFPRVPLVDFLARQQKPFRVAVLNDALPVNIEPVYGISTAAGYDYMLKRTRLMDESLIDTSYALAFTAQGVLGTDNRILDLLNVRYLIATGHNESLELMRTGGKDRFREIWSSPDASVFENERVLPRAFLVPRTNIETISSDDAQLARLQDRSFDPARNVILPGSDLPRSPEITAHPASESQSVTEFLEGTNWVRMRANAASPSVLVLSQMYYPGWVVFVDGKPSPFLRADYALSGTLLDPGSHNIEFRFRPNTFIIGVLISVSSLLLTAIGYWWFGRG